MVVWCGVKQAGWDAPFLCGAQVFCVHIVEETGVYTIFCSLCIVFSVHVWEEISIQIRETSVEPMVLYLVVWGMLTCQILRAWKYRKLTQFSCEVHGFL